MKKRVVVTGMGAVSPIGNEITTLLDNLRNGTCAVQKITRYDTTDQAAKLACEVKGFDPKEYLDAKAAKRMDLVNQFGVVAALKAIEDSGFKDLEDGEKDRFGVIVSSGIGGLSTIEKESINGERRGYDRISPFFIPMSIANMTAGLIAIHCNLHGTCIAPLSACAGGTDAIGMAFRSIRDGYMDVMLAGGSEASITKLGMGGFTAMKALSTETDIHRASIPFDKERNGFVMGEGAAILVLEELSHARKRGAKIYAEIKGYGSSCDAAHITQPNPEGKWAARAMELALQDADIETTEVDYINAHGTSTPLNDACETLAIRRLFGVHADQLMVSSTKSMTGHLLGASGALEAIITVLSLKNGFVPPTINYQVPDEQCDLFVTPNERVDKPIRVGMSNSLGFGGHNASIVIRRWDDEI